MPCHNPFTAGPARRACRSCAAADPRRPASRPTPRSASYALLSTRQGALAFNQPLSLAFDTSSVTDMSYMFSVRARSACALPPSQAPVGPSPSAPLPPPLSTPSRLPTRTSTRPAYAPSLRLSAVGVCVQPAAELRHVQRHKHVGHVPRALAACTLLPPTLQPSPPLCRLCPPPLHAPPPTFRPRTSPGILRPPLDSAESERLVRRQQAVDPLRMGGQSGQLGLHHCWLCRDLGARWLCRALGGFGKLPPLKIGQPSALRPAESVTLRPKSSVRLMDKCGLVCTDRALDGLRLAPEVRCGSPKSGPVCILDRATAACDLEVQFVLCSIPASFLSLRGNRAVRCSLYTSTGRYGMRYGLSALFFGTQRSGGLKGRITGTGTA
eukprot:scaffold45446_cov56-Phaeocystis_antarctica.AAC.2